MKPSLSLNLAEEILKQRAQDLRNKRSIAEQEGNTTEAQKILQEEQNTINQIHSIKNRRRE